MNPSKELAYILGVLMGDGSVYKREKRHEYIIKLGTTERSFAESFADTLRRLGMRPRIDVEDCSKRNSRWKKLYVVRAFSKTFYEFYKSLSSKDIKELIKGYEPYFLRGFYESEGLCYEGKGTMNIRIYNSNPTLIDIVYGALTKLGFHAIIKDRGLPRRAKKRAYEIRIKGWKESMKFILLVKPIIKVPQWIKSALEAWLPIWAG